MERRASECETAPDVQKGFTIFDRGDKVSACIGEETFLDHIDDAIVQAKELLEQKTRANEAI